MTNSGIGTDATQAQHIQTILDRNFAYKDDKYVKATDIGISLVISFEEMNISLYLPELRALMERDVD
jgi:DNA topoisomerase-3